MCDQFGFSEACAASASGEKEYRIAWRNLSTGFKGAGEWRKNSIGGKKSVSVIAKDMNQRYPEIRHWVEEREAEPKEDK